MTGPLLLLLAVLQGPAPAWPGLADLGPRVGEILPPFRLRDQDGRERDFASLAGPKGLVLTFFRSADW